MGKHANPLWLAILAWVVVAVLTGLNIQLIVQTVGALFAAL
jgi:manganese transport protein